MHYSRKLSRNELKPFNLRTAVAVFLSLTIFTFTGVQAQTDPPHEISDTTAAIPSVADTVSSSPFTLLSGSLPVLIKKDQSPYRVEADIFVSPGSTVSIEAGTIILFSNFTGLHVQGSLFVKGTADSPVVFTSVNNQEYNRSATVSAAPYDWNGIDIYESAIGSVFDNCIISYSVYGIRSQTDQVRVLSSRFLQNGKSNLSVKDSSFIFDTGAFSFNSPSPEPLGTAIAVTTTSGQTTARNALQQPRERSKKDVWRDIFRYSGMVMGAVGIAAAAQEYGDLTDTRREFDSINQITKDNMQTYTSSDWSRALRNYRKETVITGALAGTAMIGLVLFGLSFTF